MWGAIEAGGTKFVCAVIDDDGRILARHSLPTTTPDETYAAVRAFFAGRRVKALGVASFGPIDIDPASPTCGVMQATPKPGWRGADTRALLGPLGVAMAIDTDVNGAALAEAAQGAGQGLRTLAYVTVGTGIGVGVAQRGRALAGFTHYEIGHVRSPRAAGDAFAGICPSHRDCLEGMAAGPAIAARWGAGLSDLAADHPAHGVEAHYLSHLMATIALTHAPDRIVLGGGVAKAPGLLDAVRAGTRVLLGGYLAGPAGGDLSSYIVPPALGDDAGITGAAIIARQAI